MQMLKWYFALSRTVYRWTVKAVSRGFDTIHNLNVYTKISAKLGGLESRISDCWSDADSPSRSSFHFSNFLKCKRCPISRHAPGRGWGEFVSWRPLTSAEQLLTSVKFDPVSFMKVKIHFPSPQSLAWSYFNWATALRGRSHTWYFLLWSLARSTN